ncbi:transposase [candidate division WOR-3 bacterium]|nr:transposase [candidate division WOR-3 bacterium]
MELVVPEKGKKELRKGRFSKKGGFYFITTCCYKKQKIFINNKNVQIFFNSLEWFVNKEFIDLYFCITMPDHVHIVFELVGDKTLSEVIKGLKQFAGRRIKKNLGLTNPIWQEQYYDHLIRRDESLFEIIKYCWYNPVRAGIVDNPEEYPYCKSKYDLK